MDPVNNTKIRKTEDMAITVMEKIREKIHETKKAARIITFATLGFAAYEELYLSQGLSDNWKEITVYILMAYFGTATYRVLFRKREL